MPADFLTKFVGAAKLQRGCCGVRATRTSRRCRRFDRRVDEGVEQRSAFAFAVAASNEDYMSYDTTPVMRQTRPCHDGALRESQRGGRVAPERKGDSINAPKVLV